MFKFILGVCFRITKVKYLFTKYPTFLKQYFKFKKLSEKNNRFEIDFLDARPYIDEATKETSFDRHYVYHIAWAARILAKSKPKKHIDISSSLNFCSTVSAFVPFEFYDYRPPNLELTNLKTKFADIHKLPFKNNSVESISCMHTLEHIGLGRYGDEIDPNGDLKAINDLKRVVKKGGQLLIVVPIGNPKIIFNAHRIYSPEKFKTHFPEFKLEEFVLIPENAKNGGLVVNPSKALLKKQKYACGCFLFKKK